MELYLIRHGDCFEFSSEYFCEEKQTMDSPLTPQGIEQAQQLAERLKGVAFDRVYTSDQERALHTADILNVSVRSHLIISKAFREIDMGEIYTKPWNDFSELYAKWVLHKEDLSYPNGESGADVWRRCQRKIDEIIDSNFQRIAIVCHGGTIRSMICGMLDIPQHKRFFLGDPPANCSISVVVFQEKNFILHTFNDYAHITT